MRSTLFMVGIMAAMSSTSANCQPLLWQGVGPVQLGMTVKAAERALKAKLLPRQPPYDDEHCYETWRADGKDPGIGYVVENGKITVIEVYVSRGQTPGVTDMHGIGIGATEDDIRRAYGEVKKTLGFYDRGEDGNGGNGNDPQPGRDTRTSDPGYVPEFWIEAENPDRKRSILFVTRAGKVTSISIGLKPMVLEPEHCI